MLERISLPLFGRIVEKPLVHFESLQASLRKAGIKTSLPVYLSNMFFLSFPSLLIVLFAGTTLLTLLFKSVGYAFTLSITLAGAAAAFVFFLSYTYPSVRLRSIQTHIDRSLPFAVLYMATAASAGIGPVQMFRMLSTKGGSVGEEAKKIYNNVTSMGMDLPSAIQKVADRTPSKLFADLLWGMLSVITTGSSLDSYLRSRSRTMISLYGRNLRTYSHQIALYTEIYITLIVVGSLFFIILVALISPFVGLSTLFLQGFLVFFLVPFISVAYLLLVKGLNPQER